MKNICINIFILIGFISGCPAQVDTIKEAGLIFKHPNDKWRLWEKKHDTNLNMYLYKRIPVQDSAGGNVIADIGIIIKPYPDSADFVFYTASVMGYSHAKITEIYPGSDKMPKLQNKMAAVFKCKFRDHGRMETIYYIFIPKDHKITQIIMAITSDLFDKYQNEFADAMKPITEY